MFLWVAVWAESYDGGFLGCTVWFWQTPVPLPHIPFLFLSENNIGKSGMYQREYQEAI